MSLSGSEDTDVDVSAVTAYPVGAQIDLTVAPTATVSCWVFQNLHASVDIFVTDDVTKGELRVRAGKEMALDSQARKWWVRAESADTDIILSWNAS